MPATPWDRSTSWKTSIYNAYYTPNTAGLYNKNNNGPSIMDKNNIPKFVTDFGTPFGAGYWWNEFIVQTSGSETAASFNCYPHYYAVKSCNPCGTLPTTPCTDAQMRAASNYAPDFVTWQIGVYPNFDNSAVLTGYKLDKHYFIPNDYMVKGEYKLHIYSIDNADPATYTQSATCTEEQTLHVCGPTSSVLTE